MKSNAQARKERMLADWRAVLALPQGVRVITNLLAATGVHGVAFGGPDTHFTAFQEGRRAVGDFIIHQVGAAMPDKLATIIMGGMQHDFGRNDADRGDHDKQTD